LAVLIDRVDDDACPEERAVLADAPTFLFVAALVPRNAERACGLAVGPVGLGIEARKVLADDLLRRIALDALAADIPARDGAGRVEHVEGVVGNPFHQQSETAFTFEQVPLLSQLLYHTEPQPQPGQTPQRRHRSRGVRNF